MGVSRKREEPERPTTRFVYDQNSNLDGLHWSRLLDSLTLQAMYVEGADYPAQGELIEVYFMGSSHLAMVQYSQISMLKDGTKYLHIQAQRVKW